MERSSCLGSVPFWKGILRSERLFILAREFHEFLGEGKVNAIEQAMAFGFLSYWKGRECIGCCPKICTVLARCLVFYLHMHVYMLSGVVMLKPTLRYIEETVNSQFRITVGQLFSVGVDRTQNRAIQQPITASPGYPSSPHFLRESSPLISAPYHDAVRVIIFFRLDH